MQVERVQSSNYNTNFSGRIVDSSSLRKFLSGLNVKEKAVYDSYVKTIENAKDNRNYVFDYINIGGFGKVRKIAALSIQNKDKTSQFPPLFSVQPENAMEVFQKLADKYKISK
ncbi:MAG: hypothetical protein VZR09_05545 [Candidatus Gastranaerophilaceae bacterium]|nr:hypothetical protein [Candidatus Gastranaerophilaceae bacterium]